ncbi:MAG: HlyD family efflux transporter periplasmic adaptor subunit [Brumimicrobium sp.]|nr:HlyD family efflux transporter periplasmic adaptor subunit [Brumimicrobium sp.]
MNEEKEHIEDLQIRSDEVQEILSHVPNWMIRWGITLIFILLSLFLFLSWMIKYPDKIVGTTTLTTEQPPIKLITKTAGEIEYIRFKKNETVHKNDEIAVIQSTLTQEARNFLKEEIKSIQQALESQTLAKIKLTATEHTFGELQANYVALTTAIKNYQYLINEDNTAFNIRNTSKQIKNQQNLQAILKSEILNNENLLKNAKKKYESDKVLYQKGVISQADLFERQKVYESAVSQINSLKQNQISTEISITDLQKQLNDLEFNYNQKKKDFLLEINNQISIIENTLSDWRRGYEIKSPINGKLVYLENVVTNDYVEAGKALFAVVPKNQDYIAYLKIPKAGFGKVKIDQKVMLKIDNYPYQEYGQLLGKVNHISLIANEDNYLVQVKLTNGLKTTYNKEINYTPEMSGTAEIITEDLRITDRIFNQFRKTFDR